jgi:Peptidase family M49
MLKIKFSFFIIVLFLAGCTQKQKPLSDEHKAEIDNYISQYVPYDMHYDASNMKEPDKTILKKLVLAAAYIDSIYWLQTSKYGIHLRDSLEQVKNDPYAQKLLTLILRNAGPFEQLNNYKTFMGDQSYYAGDEIYPHSMTSEQFDSYIAKLPKDEQDKFMSPYSVIRPDGRGGYKAIPYHEEYKKYITPIVKLLNECADLTDNASFAKFLRLKAEALTTDNYFDADVAWIDMKDNTLDMVFGPFETYSDGIKGVKAKYEASIEVVDQAESKELDVYIKYLPELEKNLPIPEAYKTHVKGLSAKFIIVRDVIRTGDAAVGYQAVATNLPNDPEVEEKKGTTKTFWINMFEARFNAIIKPVSMKLIDESQLPDLSTEGFFQFVLMHEICHAIGPSTVKVGPKKGIAINAAIGPNYGPLEECKADITGLLSLKYLMDKGVVDAGKAKTFYVSYLGSLFRSVRFGLTEAHASAAAIALSYLYKNGGIKLDSTTQRWSIDFNNFPTSIRNLDREILILEGNGDNTKVQEFFNKWAKIIPEVQASLDKVKDLPIDVLPKYSIKWN